MAFADYCRDWLDDNLPEWVDTEHYACDLAYEITEEENNYGLVDSYEEALQLIKEYWDECADFYDYCISNFGDEYASSLNVFKEPIKFITVMFIEGVGSLLGQCPTMEDNWNDQIVFTQDIIDSILAESKLITTLF